MSQADITSPYYPYIKVSEGVFSGEQYARFPRKVCDYLLDMPVGEYTPIDDNNYPRTALWKYLYYDGAKPLNNPLPTPQQKMSVLFNPEKANDPPTDKGYRLIPQEYIQPAQEMGQTRIYVYMGRMVASQSDSKFSLSMVFDIFTNYQYELNTKTDIYSRSGGICGALINALHGVNIDGIGTFSMARTTHPDCGTTPIFDGKTNVGTRLTIGIQMATDEPNKVRDTNTMVKMSETSNIYLV